jgi:DNA-binding FadR family transcriptional regulator
VVVEPVVRDSVVDEVVERILADVLDGTYPPGSFLPAERELALGYRVTRTSLKHALVRLAQLGMVETRHGVGTQVRDYERFGGPELLPLLVQSPSSAAWMDEIFEARREIGSLVAARAALNATAQERTQLQALHAQVGAATAGDGVQLAELEVHRLLAAASGNRVYVLLANALLNAYLPVRAFLRAPFEDPAAARDRLHGLVDAVCAGAEARARAAADAYLSETERLMLGA